MADTTVNKAIRLTSHLRKMGQDVLSCAKDFLQDAGKQTRIAPSILWRSSLSVLWPPIWKKLHQI
jgi:hypothetical protein